MKVHGRCSRAAQLVLAIFLSSAGALTLSCQGVEAPDGLWEARRSGGPVVVFDLFARPLPDVPLPGDYATRPDPSSPTGRRINASMIASTAFESTTRAELDRLDGWGTFAPIAVSFEPVEQRLDLGNVLRRHVGDDFDFSDDAVYLINVDPDSPNFGEPTPIDLGEGNFPWTLRDRNDYYDNDPRSTTSTLLFETVYEDTNGNGRLDLCEDRNHNGQLDPGEDLDGDGVAFSAERDENENGVLDPEEDLNGNGRLDCSEDTDFDGVLDEPNLYCGDDDRGQPIPPWECPDLVYPNPLSDVVVPADLAWLTTWYERESNTLIMQPLVPLDERTTYAVVLTNRLVDEEGRAVESPFDAAHHVDQTNALRRLDDVLARNSDRFGGLTAEDVQFAWTFTTQSIAGEFREIREGLYGRGDLAVLAEEFPTELRIDPLHGCAPNVECELPENIHLLRAVTEGDERGLVEIITDLLDRIPLDLGADQEMIDRVIAPYDSVEYFSLIRYQSPSFISHDGVSEDLDGDGRLDLRDEDANGNGELDPGEDLDFDGHLDRNEDVNENLILDSEESAFDLDLPAGHFPHSEHSVTGFVAIPRADPERGIEPPYPVVVYNHGYGFMRIEALILAAYLARHGMATIGVDAMHHGVGGIEQMIVEFARSILIQEHLGPFANALLTDRALDLNGDGVVDSGADFVTADAPHMRDLVRQTQIDLSQLVRIVRSFDGERRWNQDLDGDGEPELAGDFDGDGVVDLGGPDADFFVTGNSLGGINSTVFSGLEPAIVAGAPISGGGGLGQVGLRTTLGSVQAAATLPAFGPLLVTNHAQRYYSRLGCSTDEDCPSGGGCVDGLCRCERDRDCSGESGYRCYEAPTELVDGGSVCATRGETACTMQQVSLRFITNDLNDDTAIEAACLEEDKVLPGDTLVARNLVNGEVDCFVAWDGARSRLHVPSDQYDTIELTVYEGEVLVEGQRCSIRDDAAVRTVVTEFGLDAEFQTSSWTAGDLLQAPQRGFGLHRATPAMRRLITVAQILLEPADPANLARRAFLDPVDYGAETQRAALLNVLTVGDDAVPISAGISIARAAGILDYSRPDPRLADEDHPGGRTANRFLIDHHVIQGLDRYSPYRREGDGRQVNFDADDFSRSGSPPTAAWPGDGLGAARPTVPLRAWRSLDESEECTCVDESGEHSCSWPGETTGPLDMVRCEEGVAALALAYFKVGGSHALIPESDPTFDVHAFVGNMIGRFFATRGREIRWNTCMHDSSCTLEDDGFYTPPVEPIFDPEEDTE